MLAASAALAPAADLAAETRSYDAKFTSDISNWARTSSAFTGPITWPFGLKPKAERSKGKVLVLIVLPPSCAVAESWGSSSDFRCVMRAVAWSARSRASWACELRRAASRAASPRVSGCASAVSWARAVVPASASASASARRGMVVMRSISGGGGRSARSARA